MRKTAIALISFVAIILITSCNNGETYADQKNAERAAIAKFISDSAINVISESQFVSQNYVTDTAKNQYVLLDKSGVYMQILNNGCGAKIKSGETATVVCRFAEFNIEGDSVQLSDNSQYFIMTPEVMTVTNSSGSFTASFDNTNHYSLMYTAYNSTSVPAGWLVPLTYIKIGRPANENEDVAKVKLIVPHSEGQSYASQYVYPCYYEITYRRGR